MTKLTESSSSWEPSAFIDDSTSPATVAVPVLMLELDIPDGVIVDGGGGDMNADLTPIVFDVLVKVAVVEAPPFCSDADNGDDIVDVCSVAMLGEESNPPSPPTHLSSSSNCEL